MFCWHTCLWAIFCHAILLIRGIRDSRPLFRHLFQRLRCIVAVWLAATSIYLVLCLFFALLIAPLPSSRLSQSLASATECAVRFSAKRCHTQRTNYSHLQKECWALGRCVLQSRGQIIISEVILELQRQFSSSCSWFISLVNLYLLILGLLPAVNLMDLPDKLRDAVRETENGNNEEAVDPGPPASVVAPPALSTAPPALTAAQHALHAGQIPLIVTPPARPPPLVRQNATVGGHQGGNRQTADPPYYLNANLQQLRNLEERHFYAIRPRRLVHNDPNPYPMGTLRAAATSEDYQQLLDTHNRPFHIVYRPNNEPLEAAAVMPLHLLLSAELIQPQVPPFVIPFQGNNGEGNVNGEGRARAPFSDDTDSDESEPEGTAWYVNSHSLRQYGIQPTRLIELNGRTPDSHERLGPFTRLVRPRDDIPGYEETMIDEHGFRYRFLDHRSEIGGQFLTLDRVREILGGPRPELPRRIAITPAMREFFGAHATQETSDHDLVRQGMWPVPWNSVLDPAAPLHLPRGQLDLSGQDRNVMNNHILRDEDNIAFIVCDREGNNVSLGDVMNAQPRSQ